MSMKTLPLISTILLSLSISALSQNDAKQILIQAREACQKIENGYYEMERHMKYMSGPDTSQRSFSCHFQKLPEDTLFSTAFHYVTFNNGEHAVHIMYTGEELVRYNLKDSTGNIMATKVWAEEISAIKHNFTFYEPFMNKRSNPLPKDEKLQDEKNQITYLGDAIINNLPCFHININYHIEKDSTEMIQTLKAESQFWISKSDFIPIQYTIAYDVVMNNDTMHQFEKIVLTKYELNHLKDEVQLTLDAVPSFVELSDYEPYEKPELLADGTMAPDWSLVDLEDNTVTLSDLNGKIVLIDFFYKSCYPCMLALPKLQELHEKYADQGLVIVGVNPYDAKEKDDIPNFLAKRGVSFTVLLDGLDVAKAYNVSGYPTTYLIDKDGSIILSKVGYGEGAFDDIENILIERL